MGDSDQAKVLHGLGRPPFRKRLATKFHFSTSKKGLDMTTHLKIAVVALALATSAPAFAQNSKSPLIGAWRMTSLQVGTGTGNLQAIPYSGQIVFTEAGTMSVQAMNPDANAAPTPYTVNGYEAFYGTVAIDDVKKTFVVTVESSLVRSLIGQKLERVFEVSGNQLILMPANPQEGFRVTYERH
jgi:hypothetical protein